MFVKVGKSRKQIMNSKIFGRIKDIIICFRDLLAFSFAPKLCSSFNEIFFSEINWPLLENFSYSIVNCFWSKVSLDQNSLMLWLGIFSSKFSAKEILQLKKKIKSTYHDIWRSSRWLSSSNHFRYMTMIWKIASKNLNMSSAIDLC